MNRSDSCACPKNGTAAVAAVLTFPEQNYFLAESFAASGPVAGAFAGAGGLLGAAASADLPVADSAGVLPCAVVTAPAPELAGACGVAVLPLAFCSAM